MTRRATPTGRRRAVPALALAAALLAGGCGAAALPGHGAHGAAGHTGHSSDPPIPAAKPAEPMTVEQLAADLGCPVKFAGKFADYRQTRCTFDGRTIMVCDFANDKAERDWVDFAKDYGGYYLLGPRWVLSGNELKDAVKLQQKFGGKIEQGMIHG